VLLLVVVLVSSSLAELKDSSEDHTYPISYIVTICLVWHSLGSSCTIQGAVFQECKTCPATCTNPGLVCTSQCQRGCGCPPGQLIDVINNRCVKPILCLTRCAVSLIVPDGSTILSSN